MLSLLTLSYHFLLASSHSWVEEVASVGENGSLGPVRGYARNNVFRLPGVEVDRAMTYKIPTSPNVFVSNTDNMCSDLQSQPNQSMAFHAKVGDTVILRYQENGHITLPEVNPGKESVGSVFVYGTWSPSVPEKFRDVHHAWMAAPNETNHRGFLIKQTSFDDGRCHQVNNGTISQERQAAFPHPPTPPEGVNLWCGTNFTIPARARCAASEGPTLDLLSVYWVWDWPGTAGNTSAEQYYTTCVDIWVSNKRDG